MSKLRLKRSHFLVAAAVLVVLLVIVEICLRAFWGFGDMVLFTADDKLEYIAQPNQNKVRFGNHIQYNEHSMRSKPLSPSDSCVVLGLGDSVINGGTLTDQDSLATTIVESEFAGSMRFLNVSAGSWGPDNCAAYVKKYGDFDAKMIILFVSSHDAHDNMTFEETVGVHEAYPAKQYPFAIVEVLDKYALPRLMAAVGKSSQTNDLMINKNGQGFNTGFQDLLDLSRAKGIPLVICLHAERLEVEQGSFNEQGKEILKFCTENNIKTITGFEVGEKANNFRDDIHLNESGQKIWVPALKSVIENNLNSCVSHL